MTKLRPVSRDGFPSVGDALAAQEAAREAVAVVAPRTALAWALESKVRLPARGRLAAINAARLDAGLPPFVIDLRLIDRALPPLHSKAGAVVIGRERRVGTARESGIPDTLQAALLGWWRTRFSVDVEELVVTRAALSAALEPLIGEMQAAVGQP